MNNPIQHLNNYCVKHNINSNISIKLLQLAEVEQRKIAMVINRIEKRNGSITHFLKYLTITLG